MRAFQEMQVSFSVVWRRKAAIGCLSVPRAQPQLVMITRAAADVHSSSHRLCCIRSHDAKSTLQVLLIDPPVAPGNIYPFKLQNSHCLPFKVQNRSIFA